MVVRRGQRRVGGVHERRPGEQPLEGGAVLGQRVVDVPDEAEARHGREGLCARGGRGEQLLVGRVVLEPEREAGGTGERLRLRERVGEPPFQPAHVVAVRGDEMDVDAAAAERVDRREVQLERVGQGAAVARPAPCVDADEHLEHELDPALVERPAHVGEPGAEVLLDRAGAVAPQLDRLEPCRRGEDDLLDGRAPVAGEESADHADLRPHQSSRRARIARVEASSGDSLMIVAGRSNPASASRSGSARSVPSP